jgi:hypothetical protein
MNLVSKTCLALTFAAAVLAASSPAFARQGRGSDDVAAPSGSAVAGSKLSVRLRSKGNGGWEFRMNLERAPSGLSPEVFVADASGLLTSIGSLVPDNGTAGEYKLRLRSRKGSALPLGAASLTELGGRAYEVRDGGVAIFSGSLPLVDAKRRGADDAPGHVRQGRGADDVTTKRQGADDAPGHVRRGRGADDLKREGGSQRRNRGATGA